MKWPCLLLSLSGCTSAPTLSTPDPGASPQVVQARAVLNQQLNRAPFVKDVVFIVDTGQIPMINYTDPNTGEGKSVVLTDLLPASIAVSYSPSPNAYTEPAWKVSYSNFQDGHAYFWLWSGWSQADAQQIADALRVLVLDGRQKLDAVFAARYQKFLGLCQTWLESKTAAPVPEVARQHQLLARDAMSRNDTDKAVDEYDAALLAAPCWAEGRYQAALVEAQMGYYAVAVQDMKKYLLLSPNTPNAQAARNQILIWNGRMGVE
ncbi:MAG: tetratricopeptide repeat protein [Bacillota bacterium]